jgi:Fic family protein
VLERAGGRLDDLTVATLNAQRDALEMVIDFVRDERRLSPSFIKELHHACTRTQTTYTATDALGQVVERELPHGRWKQWSNHVVRQDGSRLEYCPPEHVDAEVDNLTQWYEELEQAPITAHPIVKAAWLHHRFVQIHPFADGNGRVARALTLLVMQRHHYAPMVVDRFHRAAYQQALDAANDGDLRPRVALFTNLESSALASELESAIEPERGTSTKVAHTLAAQLSARRDKERLQRRKELEVRALAVAAMASHWISAKRAELISLFHEQGIQEVKITSFDASSAKPEPLASEDEQPHHLWFRRQVIQSARRAGHYADFGGFVGLTTLRIAVGSAKLNFMVSLHGAGVDEALSVALVEFMKYV